MTLYYKHDLLYKCLKQHFQFLFYVLAEIQTLDTVHHITVTVRKYRDPPIIFPLLVLKSQTFVKAWT